MSNGKIINFTNRDFESLQKSAYEFIKQYYPDTFKDFSQNSVGAMIVDLMCYIGDNLSFYLDFQANEMFLDTAQQFENILKLAREKGYKDTGKPSSSGPIDVYIIVPANQYGEPNRNYLPILQKNSIISAQQTGASFLVAEDIDFALDDAKFVVASVDSNGVPATFAVKKSGTVVSGALFSQKDVVTTFDNFLKIKINNQLMSEIVSVVDSNGNEYYQVDYLSQNVVYKFIKNTNSDSNLVPYKLVRFYTPRRFVVEQIDGFYYMIFGNGSIDAVTDPRMSILNFNARKYVSDRLIDPTNIIQSDKFGIAPNNTTLTTIYRANNSSKMGVAAGFLNKVLNPSFKFSQFATERSIINSVASSIEIENPEPISNVNQTITAEELRRRAFDAYSAQYRAVTKEDYINACYSLEPKLGSIKRANIFQDTNSFKRNLNLYVVGEDSSGNLITCPQTLKDNLKTSLLMQKMINDTIDILDTKIINLGIEFTCDTNEKNKELVLEKCINALIQKFNEKMDIGQSFPINEVYKTLNLISEVIDTKRVKIFLQNGTGYNSSNFDIYANLSADGSYIYCPQDCIFEIKNPIVDIKGTIV